MTKNLKNLFKFFYSLKALYIGIPVIVVAGLFLFYSLIPLPNISDGYMPDDVRKVTYNAPLTVHFSQPMNQLSVQANFSINPKLEGELKWVDSQTLEFSPSKPLNINDEYKVTIGSEAKSSYLKALGVDFVLRFVVAGSPYVKFISPYPYPDTVETPVRGPILAPVGAPIVAPIADSEIDIVDSGFVEDVPPLSLNDLIIIPKDQKVTIMFDRPMRELTTIDQSASSQSFPELKIDPPVKGSYRWVGTTAFQFIPEEWTMGTTYTLILPKDITALDGGKTEEETVWQLATEEPKILSSDPYEANDAFSVNGEITLAFNQPMELDYIRPGDNVLLYPSNDSDAEKNPKQDGFFNTEVVYGKDADGKTDKTILVFRPEFPYLYNQDYKLVVKAGIEGAAKKLGNGYGERLSGEDFILNFRTIKKPGIVSFLPVNGEQNYKNSFIKIYFASPMTKELIENLVSLEPKPDEAPSISVYQTTNSINGSVWEATIGYDLQPSKYYNFEFKGPFKDTYGNSSDKGFKTSFKTAAVEPSMNLLTTGSFGLFMDGLGPIYTMKSVNINEATVEFCGMSEQEFFNMSQSYGWYNYHCANPTRANVSIKSKLNEMNYQDLDLKEIFNQDFGHGIYFFEVSSRQYINPGTNMPYRFYQTFFMTDTNLTLKKSGQDLLVWATDLKTGKPVARMDIKVMSYTGLELQHGVTDGNGIYKISKEFGDNVYAVGSKTLEGENRWSMVSQYWSDGIQSWQYNFNGQWATLNEPRVYLYTERPIYKPEDEVFYKGIYRIDKDAKLSLPTDKKIRIVVEDPEYNEIESKEVAVLSDGSFSSSFKIGSEAKLGQYNIYAETAGKDYPQRFYAYFFIEEYKKPIFKVDILGSQVDYQAGQNVSLDISANYYFGGGIGGGKVNWTLMREPYFFDKYKGDDYYSFGVWNGFRCFWDYCTSSSEISAEGEDMLDKNGQLHLQIPKDAKTETGQSYLYTLNATVTNKDGETVSKRDTYIVHQGAYYIGLSPKNYITEPGSDFKVKVITVTPDAKIVQGKKISLELYREKWNTVKKQGVDGNFYDEGVRELEFIKKQSVTTSSEPIEAEIPIDENTEGGGYVIQAKSSEGGDIISEVNFYVSSVGYVDWGVSNNNRMEIVADQPEYFVGGKAKILIKSPFGSEKEPVKALVTYERAGIQNYEVIDIKSNSDTIEVPIDEAMVPNVYISVMVIKGAGANFDTFTGLEDKERMAKQQTELDSKIKELEAEIETLESSTDEKEVNRNKILISKKVTELTKLKDDLSKISESLESVKEKDVAEVDYSQIKPDFKLGITNLVVSRREHKIFIDLKTSKPSYQVGEKVSIDIHTLDYQNRPVSAVVSLAVVDESLLALKANQKVDPLDYFYGQRALQVDTSSSLTLQMDRVNIKSAQGAKGGDGGADEGFDKKRGDFKDTAYFNPVIQTDSGGYAKVEFDPPDNLTMWQMWAVASAKEDKFGMITEDFTVKKPLAATPILPRFVISGDQLTIGALVHNQTGADLDTKVSIKTEGLIIKGADKKSLFVRDNGSERIDFQIEAEPVSNNSTATVEIKVEDGSGQNSDVAVYSLPVQVFAYPETVAVNGTVDTDVTEKIRIPSNIAPDMGELIVRAGGSILTSFIKQFKELADYPYGCAEQVTSQILPTLVVLNEAIKLQKADLPKILNIDVEKSKKIIADTLQKVSKFQRFDGGYGFWEGSVDSYPMLTSYVFYAQHLAMQTGFTVSENSYKLAIQYLWNRLNDTSEYRKIRNEERAFILWALSEAGESDTGMTLSLYEKRSDMSLYAKALMLMNMDNLNAQGQRSISPFADKLKSEIIMKQIVEDRTIHFEEESQGWWDLSTDRRTTAMILMALNRNNPHNPILSQMVNYFVTSNKKGALTNTQETAWELMAMLEYAESQDILDADFAFSAKLNSAKFLEGTVDTSNLEQVFEKQFGISELKSGDELNQVTFTKDGKGQMSYDMELKYYLPNELVPPMEKGFFITRNYYEFDTDQKDKIAANIKSGGVYRGELNIIVPEDMHFVVVEERLPAGFEGINFNLATTDMSLQNKLQEETQPKTGEYYWYDNPLWYFNHTETRDDRVLLFADYLPRGVYTYSFLVRAGLPGKYHHLPASAYEMYFPEVFGRTGGEWVEVKE